MIFLSSDRRQWKRLLSVSRLVLASLVLHGCNAAIDQPLDMAGAAPAKSSDATHPAAPNTSGPKTETARIRSGAGFSTAGTHSRTAIDIHTTVAAALRHSPKVRRARADLSGTNVDVKIAYAGFHPEFQSEAGVGTDQAYDYELSLAQPIYDWGRTGADIGRAKAQERAAEANLLEAAELAALEAVEAHIAVQRSRRLVDAAHENLDAHRRFTRLANDRASGGVGDATEVELAGVHEGEAHSSLADARGALRNALSVYYTRVGLEPKALAEIPELPLDLLKQGNVAAATLNAPAVVAARARQEAARNAASMERAGLLPKLSAEAYIRGRDIDDPATGVGLRVTGPTVKGLRNFNRVEAAELEAASAKWAAEAARREATIRVDELVDREPTLRSRIRILREQLENARSLRDLYEDQFKIGTRSVADLVNVQADVFRIENGLINARYDIVSLQYSAAAALGHLMSSLQVNLEGR